MKIRLITAVWGRRYIDSFLRFTLKTLLAEGNVAALAARHSCTYKIYTTEDGATEIRRSPLLAQLAAAIDLEILIFGSKDVDLSDPSSHWHVWRPAAEAARQSRETVFFIIPDALFAMGTLLRWAELFEQGFRAVWTVGPQVVLETTLTEIEQRFPPDSSPTINLSISDVHRLAVRQLHPLMISMFRDSRRWTGHPEAILQNVPGSGLAMRMTGSHPICVDLNHFAVTDAFCPLDHLESIAFEQCRFVCLEPILKYSSSYYRARWMDDVQLSNLGSWADYFCVPSDMINSYVTYRLSAGEPDERGFRRAEMALATYMSQFRIVAAVFRIARMLDKLGCKLSAQLLAATQIDGRLRRRWRIRGPITIFAPNDEALEARRLEVLLRPGNENLLAAAVARHVVAGSIELRVGDHVSSAAEGTRTTTGAGNKFGQGRNLAVEIVAGPIELDACTIYIVNRHLLSRPHEHIRAIPSKGILPDRWTVAPGRIDLSPQVGQAAPTVLPGIHPKFRAVILDAYHALTVVPGVRWLAHACYGTYKALQDWHRGTRAQPLVPGAIEALAPLQAARTMLILFEILQFYQRKIADLGLTVPSLALVEAQVKAIGISDALIEQNLYALVHATPNFADAWLELAYCHFDRAEFNQAIDCAERCIASTAAISVSPRKPTAVVLALVVKAAALEAKGSVAEAAEAYRRAFRSGARPGIISAHYARVLRRLGKYEEALRYFFDGLTFDVEARELQLRSGNFDEFARELAAWLQRLHDASGNARVQSAPVPKIH